jgi:hypothetical protein
MRLIGIVFFMALFFACNQGNDIETMQTRSSEGELTILNYKLINGDTSLEGEEKYYWIDGQIKNKAQFKNGVKNGWSFYYDSLGNLKNKYFYKDGLKDSIAFFYDTNGKVSTEEFYIRGVKVFKNIMLSNSLLPAYQVIRKNGFVQYIVLFDSAGKKNYENGYIFDDTLQVENGLKIDSIKVGETVEAKIFTTKLPGYSRKIMLDYFGNDNKKTNINYQIIDEGFYTFIKFTPSKVGKANIVLIGELRDGRNVLVKKDTLVTKINVVGG